jgi:hypothetical protein
MSKLRSATHILCPFLNKKCLFFICILSSIFLVPSNMPFMLVKTIHMYHTYKEYTTYVGILYKFYLYIHEDLLCFGTKSQIKIL